MFFWVLFKCVSGTGIVWGAEGRVGFLVRGRMEFVFFKFYFLDF